MKTLKNRKNIFTLLAASLIIVFVISSCKKDKTEPDGNNNFDQRAMLKNYADNLIIPSYQATANSLGELSKAMQTFEQNFSIQNLEIAQQKWKALYTNWMRASGYNFGPAGEQGVQKRLVEEISTFPIDTVGLKVRMAATDTSFSDFKRDTRGLLAVEFLLFNAKKTNAEIVSEFVAGNQRIIYAKVLIKHIEGQLAQVLSQWQNGYRNSFIQNTGTDVGSSVSIMYNEFVQNFETIKNYKLGIPLGKKAGQSNAEPNKVEAFFSGQSFVFLKENITALENTWLGKSKNDVDGIGWKEFIQSATGGADLIGSTQEQQRNINNSLSNISVSQSLSSQILNNPAELDDLYTELQKQTRFYKSDMSSLLGIAITFTDADGD